MPATTGGKSQHNTYEAMLEDFSADITEASYDNVNSISLVTSDVKVVDFDKFSKQYIKKFSPSDCPHSTDALYFEERKQRWQFVEFKRSGISDGINAEIKFKALESLLILLDSWGKTLEFSREKLDYVLVYNEEARHTSRHYLQSNEVQESASRDKIAKSVFLGKRRLVQFDLLRYKGIYYRDVTTYTAQEFEEYLAEQMDRPGA